MRKLKILVFGTIISLLGYYLYPESQLTKGQQADKIMVYKSEHVLRLYHQGKIIASYSVSISKKGLDAKKKCGDNLTPEGQFHITKRTWSAYHKAIGVGYGCDVLIHGQKYGWVGKFHRWKDWTLGCIALTNTEIDEVYDAVTDGCVIEIRP
ncbi:MAG: murein L,D-transpeptidase family protein [Flavobacteriales bacterium]